MHNSERKGIKYILELTGLSVSGMIILLFVSISVPFESCGFTFQCTKQMYKSQTKTSFWDGLEEEERICEQYDAW